MTKKLLEDFAQFANKEVTPENINETVQEMFSLATAQGHDLRIWYPEKRNHSKEYQKNRINVFVTSHGYGRNKWTVQPNFVFG